MSFECRILIFSQFKAFLISTETSPLTHGQYDGLYGNIFLNFYIYKIICYIFAIDFQLKNIDSENIL